MQSPTPPTKPTPPTPPSMKTSTGISSTDTHVPTATTPQSINSSKIAPTAKEQSMPIPASMPQSTNNLPPLSSVSTANNAFKETTSERLIPSTTKSSKDSFSTTGFSAFFVLICIIAITLVAIHWWKNYQPKQRPIVDYSTESSDEIVKLILSKNSLESATQALPKTKTKKITPQVESTPKTKGTFEVRV